MTARIAGRGPSSRQNRARRQNRAHGRTRAGFTLLELLGVILIIAILIAIAVPSFNAVMRRARIATVKAEMTNLGGVIAEFKSKFGTEPPSRIRFTTAAGAAPGSAAALAPDTKAILRQMFPQIEFNAALQTSLTQAGLWGEELKGTEALVFFLGGVRLDPDANAATPLPPDAKQLVGFSKNPSNPFVQPTSGQSNRAEPMFEFDFTRLVAIPDGTNDPGTTPQLAYRDVLSPSNPYIYASTAATGSYRDGATAATTDFPAISATAFFKAYRKPDSTPAVLTNNPLWNPNSFQLISPGADGQYGDGGVYDPSAASPVGSATADRLEYDNITNFADGPLGG